MISTRQLGDHGLSRSAIARLHHSGIVQRHGDGVYVARAAPVTYEAALWSAALRSRGVLGFATATHCYGMIDEPGDLIDSIIEPTCGTRRLPGVRLHRTLLLASDRTVRNGLPITTRTCSALDYLGRLRGSAAIRFADRALQQGWIRRTDIQARLTNQPGRTGNTRLREILEITGDGAAARSERLLHAILREGGITGWAPNLAVALGAFYCEVDVGFAELKLAIEVDGMAFHTSPDRFQRDRTKQNRLIEQGWIVLRFTWDDLINRPDHVLAQIRRQMNALTYR